MGNGWASYCEGDGWMDGGDGGDGGMDGGIVVGPFRIE